MTITIEIWWKNDEAPHCSFTGEGVFSLEHFFKMGLENLRWQYDTGCWLVVPEWDLIVLYDRTIKACCDREMGYTTVREFVVSCIEEIDGYH